MSSGYIYCLSNQCTSGIYKVSYVPDSQHHLKKLLDDMNSGNLPHPYVMEFAKKTDDVAAKMKIVDKILTKLSSNTKLNANFYKIDLSDIRDIFELIDGEWDDYIEEDDFDTASVSSLNTTTSSKTNMTSTSNVSRQKSILPPTPLPSPLTPNIDKAGTSKSGDDDIFIIERTIDNLFINNEYGYIFMLTTSDRSIRCLGKLSESMNIEPLDKEDIVIVDKNLGIRYTYDTSTVKEFDFSGINRMTRQDSYILTIDEDGKYVLNIHNANKITGRGRDMSKYFLDGQVIRHVYMKDTWLATYKSSDKCLHHESGKHKTPTGFAKAHIKACTGDATSSINGWKLCETMIGNEWIIIDSVKPKK